MVEVVEKYLKYTVFVFACDAFDNCLNCSVLFVFKVKVCNFENIEDETVFCEYKLGDDLKNCVSSCSCYTLNKACITAYLSAEVTLSFNVTNSNSLFNDL